MMDQQLTLEKQVEQLLQTQPTRYFAEQPPLQQTEGQNSFSGLIPKLGGLGQMTKVGGSNVVVFALGAIFSEYISDAAKKFIPDGYDQYATIIGGLLIMYLGRSSAHAKAFGTGVLIQGIAKMWGSKVRGYFDENETVMQEDRVTYGGSDGIYPTNPERKTFS